MNDDYDWRDDAVCASVGGEVFFPEKENGWLNTRKAKAICATCPVTQQCLEDAPVDDIWSIRGGLTASERRKLRKQAVA